MRSSCDLFGLEDSYRFRIWISSLAAFQIKVCEAVLMAGAAANELLTGASDVRWRHPLSSSVKNVITITRLLVGWSGPDQHTRSFFKK